MRLTVENFFLILALLLFEAWFLKGYFSGSPEFEPAIGFIVSLGALFTKDKVKEHFGLSSESGSHDISLFEEFQRVFPAEPTLRLLKETDFGSSIRKADIQPLYDFVERWDSIDKEFLNKKIEKEKKALYESAKDLANEFVTRTVPIGDGNFISVFPDSLRGGPRPQHVLDDAKVLNEKSRVFVPIYEAFVRKCKSILRS